MGVVPPDLPQRVYSEHYPVRLDDMTYKTNHLGLHHYGKRFYLGLFGLSTVTRLSSSTTRSSHIVFRLQTQLQPLCTMLVAYSDISIEFVFIFDTLLCISLPPHCALLSHDYGGVLGFHYYSHTRSPLYYVIHS